MSTDYTIMSNTAMPYNMIKSSMSQEVICRLLMTDTRLGHSVRTGIVEKFIAKLIKSKYELNQIQGIVIAGLKGYKKKNAW